MEPHRANAADTHLHLRSRRVLYRRGMSELDENGDHSSQARRRRGRGILISWPALSSVLALSTLAALGSLIVVATVQKADALATVALVLAIVAFGAQLIVTAAQTMSGNEQYRQVNRLYEDTRGVLVKIRAQNKMLLVNQSDQFNKILDHVLSPSAIESAVAEARGELSSEESTDDGERTQADPGEVAKLLRAEAEKALAEERKKPSAVGAVSDRPSNRDPGTMLRFPTESEGMQVVAAYRTLGSEAKDYIQKAAERYARNPKRLMPGSLLPYSLHDAPGFMRELERNGFLILEPIRRDGQDKTVRRWTAQGITAMRFFTGQGIVPQYLRDIVGSAT